MSRHSKAGDCGPGDAVGETSDQLSAQPIIPNHTPTLGGRPVIRISPRRGDLSTGHQDMRPHGGILSRSRPAGRREARRALARIARKGGAG